MEGFMYKITFSDLTTFNGGNYFKTRWNEIFKPILSIEYYFQSKKLFLSGFEQYCLLIEGCWDVIEKKTKIERTHLLVKQNNSVFNYTFDLIKKTISVKSTKWSEDKTSSWKIGLAGTPVCRLI